MEPIFMTRDEDGRLRHLYELKLHELEKLRSDSEKLDKIREMVKCVFPNLVFADEAMRQIEIILDDPDDMTDFYTK